MHLELPRPLTLALALLALVGVFAAPKLRADAGHDHGAAAPSTAGQGLPRFAAASDLFELVGVVNGRQLTLYLDHSADNSPVKGAKLELEIGASKLDAKPRADGEFEATLAQPLKPGVIPVTASIATERDTDLLAGEVLIAQELRAEAPQARDWPRVAGWTAAGLFALAALAWLRNRAKVRFSQRAVRSAGAA
ncbi:MAG: hypothetical protein WA210_07415 [Burkholderiaceae bacterium]